MYLKNLNIEYFRCFKKYEVEFAPRVTILFGKNGSGKSTLIHAIHKALSFIFKRTDNEINLTAGFPELKVETFNKNTDGVRDWKTGMIYPYIKINANGAFMNIPLEWEMYASTSTYNFRPTKYTNAYEKVIEKIRETEILPFIAYYSDSFPHIPKPKKVTREQYELRNVGYIDWNQESACSELWIERYRKTWLEWDRANRTIEREESALRNCEVLLQKGMIETEEYNEDVQLHKDRLARAQTEKNKYDDEINQIKSCLIKFSKGNPSHEIVDVFVSVYEEEGVCLETKQGNNPSFHKLPAGYKRLFYMVLDIAYRSYMLNKHTNPRGIVIIDEIDLHLHPELEKIVLKRFMETFPNLQFIVSTHSPLVLTGLETVNENNRILKMEAGQNTPEVMFDIYGLDLNSGMQEVMGINPNDDELNRWISRCAYMRGKGYKEQADNLLKFIEAKNLLSSQEIENRINKILKD